MLLLLLNYLLLSCVETAFFELLVISGDLAVNYF